MFEVLHHRQEPDPKQQKSAQETEERVERIVKNVEEEDIVLQQENPNTLVNWWQSGDARLLFAKCDVLNLIATSRRL